MVLHGPIIFHMVHCRCTQMGPLVLYSALPMYPDGPIWHMQRLLLMILHGPINFYTVHCQCTEMGPLEYVESAADDFAWAHYFSYGVPPMYWNGPIGTCRGCCQ
jgi:hypothetical protein